MIVFTCDIDGASEPVIADTLELFEQYQTKCTFFATHKSNELSFCNQRLFEIGIHPNFNFLLDGKGGSVDEILDDLLNLYPKSQGVRSHSLTQNTPILNKFSEKGLLYDANQFAPYSNTLNAYRLWNNMVRIPFNWEDDLHALYGFSFEDPKIDLNTTSLNIFNFHPIHIFLNMDTLDRYKKSKPFLNDPVRLCEYKNTQTPGVRNLLEDLLKSDQNRNYRGKLLQEIANSV